MKRTTHDVAVATAKPILEYGRAWMMDPGTAQRSGELGLSGRFGFWTNGRAGVLGDVDASIAAAAIGFMDPSAVAEYWHARPAELSAWAAAEAWFGQAAIWGRTTLASMPDDQLVELLALAQKVVANTDVSIGALFAGSKNIDLPGDLAGDVTVVLNVLREMRAGAHLSAVHAVGLGPHGAILSTDDPVRGGSSWAEGFGWKAPHPAPDNAARLRAEEITNTICARSYECLDDGERDSFVDLVATARALLDS